MTKWKKLVFVWKSNTLIVLHFAVFNSIFFGSDLAIKTFRILNFMVTKLYLKFSQIPIKKILLTLFLQGGNQLVIILMAVLAARSLSIEEFGQYSFGFHVANLAATIASMGSGIALAKVFGISVLPVGVQRAEYCYRHHNSILNQGAVVLIAMAIPIFYIFGLAMESAAFCICLSVYIVMLQANYFVAIGRAPVGNMLQLSRSTVFILIFFILSFLFKSRELVWITVIFVSIYSIATVIFLGIKRSFAVSGEKIDGASAYALQHWLSVLIVNVDILLLKVFSSDESLAIYSVSLFLSSASSFGLYAINANSMSEISKLISSGNKLALQNKLTSYAWAAFVISVVFIGVIVGISYNVELLFGEGYGEAFSIYIILLLGQVINILVGSVALIANVSGFPKRVTQSMILALALKLVVGIMLIGFYDLYGVAIAAALANSLWNTMLLIFVVRHLGLNPTIFSVMGRFKSV